MSTSLLPTSRGPGTRSNSPGIQTCLKPLTTLSPSLSFQPSPDPFIWNIYIDIWIAETNRYWWTSLMPTPFLLIATKQQQLLTYWMTALWPSWSKGASFYSLTRRKWKASLSETKRSSNSFSGIRKSGLTTSTKNYGQFGQKQGDTPINVTSYPDWIASDRSNLWPKY